MSVEEVHSKILRTAAARANKDSRLPPYLQGSDIFRLPADTTKLALWLEPAAEEALADERRETRSREEVFAVLQTVVKESVAFAIAQHKNDFVGLILDEGRQGRIYPYAS